MKVDVWSDVRCPFCYIGKRKFEQALENFEQKEQVDVKWRSFELDPFLKTDPDISASDYLVESKGISRNQVRQMIDQVSHAAQEVGLAFDFEKNVVANSFHAHRLIQCAQSVGLGEEAGEAMFKAHFSDGENIDDAEVLREVGRSIGLDEAKLEKLLSSKDFDDIVKADQEKARNLGIRGVPFFIFDHKYAVSGAQPPAVFLEALQRSWTEWSEERKDLDGFSDHSCSVDGECF